MKRQLFSQTSSCSGGCLYCFSRWKGYSPPPSWALGNISEQCDVIYPSCDGDFLNSPDALKSLKALIHHAHRSSTIVSFSTKGSLSEDLVRALARINDHLIRKRKGFLKISISLSSISLIDEIEPHTASLEQRIRGLALLRQHKIPCAVTLRPILPFVEIQEYCEIIQKTREFTDLYLLGDLYVEPSSAFFKKYIEGRFEVRRRNVRWLDSQPEWLAVEAPDLKQAIQNNIAQLAANSFDSELDLVAFIKARLRLESVAQKEPVYYFI